MPEDAPKTDEKGPDDAEYCPDCGAQRSADEKFCTVCGKSFEPVAAPEAEAEPAAAPINTEEPETDAME